MPSRAGWSVAGGIRRGTGSGSGHLHVTDAAGIDCGVLFGGLICRRLWGLLGRVQKLLLTGATSAGTKTGEGLSNTA